MLVHHTNVHVQLDFLEQIVKKRHAHPHHVLMEAHVLLLAVPTVVNVSQISLAPIVKLRHARQIHVITEEHVRLLVITLNAIVIQQ
jgi:hypothetical protein